MTALPVVFLQVQTIFGTSRTKIMQSSKCLFSSMSYTFIVVNWPLIHFLDIYKILFEVEGTIVLNGSCRLDLVPWKQTLQ